MNGILFEESVSTNLPTGWIGGSHTYCILHQYKRFHVKRSYNGEGGRDIHFYITQCDCSCAPKLVEVMDGDLVQQMLDEGVTNSGNTKK